MATIPKNQPIFTRPAPPTPATPKATGRVMRVIEKPRSKGGTSFFFIDSGGVHYFAAIDDVRTGELPPLNAVVRFDPLKVYTPGKCDRAVNVEIVSAPG
jgi:hypothetical protein